MSEPIRVLIVDDHPLIRRALIRTLQEHTDIEVIGEGSDGFEAIEKTRELKPDVVIMDLGLPNMNGMQAIQEIIREDASARVLVLSGSDEPETVQAALEAGALGFIGKASGEWDIVKAIRNTYQGMATLRGDILRKIVVRKQGEKQKKDYRDLLSDRERDIAERIAKGETNHMVAEALFLSESTIRSHINHILRKLDLKSRVDLVRFILLGIGGEGDIK